MIALHLPVVLRHARANRRSVHEARPSGESQSDENVQNKSRMPLKRCTSLSARGSGDGKAPRPTGVVSGSRHLTHLSLRIDRIGPE